jgi:hypothetical protein
MHAISLKAIDLKKMMTDNIIATTTITITTGTTGYGAG